MAATLPEPGLRRPWADPLPGSDPEGLAAIGREVEARLDANPKVQRIASPRIDMFAMANFVNADECAALIALIDADAAPSTSLRASGSESRRSSFTCRFGPEQPLVADVDRRLSLLLGIGQPHGEALQGQRYQPGQEFKLHNDYFASGQSYSADIAAEGGQRTWTAMVYLNRTGGGGETSFPRVPVAIAPTPGVLLIWNNLSADGLGNPYSHHAGVKVDSGEKYILTKWYRERSWTPRAGGGHYQQ